MYGLTGTTDSEYKDIVFAMERMKFVGANPRARVTGEGEFPGAGAHGARDGRGAREAPPDRAHAARP